MPAIAWWLCMIKSFIEMIPMLFDDTFMKDRSVTVGNPFLKGHIGFVMKREHGRMKKKSGYRISICLPDYEAQWQRRKQVKKTLRKYKEFIDGQLFSERWRIMQQVQQCNLVCATVLGLLVYRHNPVYWKERIKNSATSVSFSILGINIYSSLGLHCSLRIRSKSLIENKGAIAHIQMCLKSSTRIAIFRIQEGLFLIIFER